MLFRNKKAIASDIWRWLLMGKIYRCVTYSGTWCRNTYERPITILPEIAMARTKWQHARRRVTAVVNINNTFRRSHSNHVRCNYITDFMVFASVLSNLLKSLLVGPRH